MRCPHCDGEILDSSRFCGICGRQIAIESHPAPAQGILPGEFQARVRERAPHLPAGPRDAIAAAAAGRPASMSLFVLPISRGARISRLLAILALDLALCAAGIVMIASYLRARAEAAALPAGPASQITDPAGTQPGPGHLAPGQPTSSSPRNQAPASAPASQPGAGQAASGGPGGSSGPGPASDATNAGKRDQTPATPNPSRPGDTRPPGSGSSAPGNQPADPGKKEPGATTPDAPGDPRSGEPGAGDGGITEPENQPDARTQSSTEPTEPTEPTEEDIRRVTREVSLVVSNNQNQLQRCHEQAGQASVPPVALSGRVDVELTIEPDGKPSGVRVVKNDTGSEELARCVTGVFSGWQFPVPPGGRPLDLVWPLRFRAPR